jgi:hypothetical protein
MFKRGNEARLNIVVKEGFIVPIYSQDLRFHKVEGRKVINNEWVGYGRKL